MGTTVLRETDGVQRTRVSAPAVLAVLDGLGGHPAGDVASDLAARLLTEAEVPRDAPSCTELLERADAALHDAMSESPGRFGMGTTVAMISLLGDGPEIMAANVGDSPTWLWTDTGLVELSERDRAPGGGILQCLGAGGDGIAPHVRQVTVAPGDRLVLASDGLSDVVSAATIGAVLRDHPDDAADRLVAMVRQAGVPDDLTVVVAEVVPD